MRGIKCASEEGVLCKCVSEEGVLCKCASEECVLCKCSSTSKAAGVAGVGQALQKGSLQQGAGCGGGDACVR